jgi:heat-inducible transcriptional repressor
MVPRGLDDRSKEVLKLLIQLYIATGEPVGSESLAQMMNRSLSPATIRNIMADLERLGYLDHPHTSAGRRPTDLGYRFYVTSLMNHKRLAPREAAAISCELRPREASPTQVLEHACQILSRLSHSVGFVLAPGIGRTTLRHLEFIDLLYGRVLVVLVSWAGLVTHKIIEVEERLGQDELQACGNYLNTHFAGMTLAQIRERLLELMAEEKALYDSLLQRVLTLGQQAFAVQEHEGAIFIDGASNILDQPEFEDVGQMKALFKAFEEKGRLVKILNACLAGSGIRITIGHEIPDPKLSALAMVTASYPVDGDTSWGLGVMGSTRMEYARVVPVVDHVARAVSQTLSEPTRGAR